ncbi:MAG: MBL fold metallo-hydrolase, partial [Dehalococcoidia bacterium]|nr:MBL fold metallo-hydrolase [Dehalococcoidia bacterium]
FWDRAIDVVALTHPQEDHLAGLIDALERYDVGQVIATPREADTDTYHEWRDLIGRRGIPSRAAGAGDAIDLGGGARLEVLGPTREALASGDVNDASLVLKLTWGEVSFLLTGDIEVRGEEALLASDADLRSTVLKLAHHGSNTSSSAAFLRAVEPAVAVVSVGADNTFGHPSPEVLQRLSESAVFRTDRHGTVRLSTDGERLWVEAERSGR